MQISVPLNPLTPNRLSPGFMIKGLIVRNHTKADLNIQPEIGPLQVVVAGTTQSLDIDGSQVVSCTWVGGTTTGEATAVLMDTPAPMNNNPNQSTSVLGTLAASLLPGGTVTTIPSGTQTVTQTGTGNQNVVNQPTVLRPAMTAFRVNNPNNYYSPAITRGTENVQLSLQTVGLYGLLSFAAYYYDAPSGLYLTDYFLSNVGVAVPNGPTMAMIPWRYRGVNLPAGAQFFLHFTGQASFVIGY
jgi:hypothetical protein